jgi:glycosyltransferase involved in cell wall biosynthesis
LGKFIFPENAKKGRPSPLAICSIVVCTKNRTHHWRRCLDSIFASNTPETEIIVVDNATSDNQTKQLSQNYLARYIREPHHGLNWARSRGALEAGGETVFYIDDDVIMEKECLAAESSRSAITLGKNLYVKHLKKGTDLL